MGLMSCLTHPDAASNDRPTILRAIAATYGYVREQNLMLARPCATGSRGSCGAFVSDLISRIVSPPLTNPHWREWLAERAFKGRLRYAVASLQGQVTDIIVTTHWGGIVERFVDDVVILDVRGGPIAFSKGSDQLLNAIRQLVQRDSRKILLNLRDVRYIDSDGLREIVEGFQTTGNGGGILKLCEVVPGIRRLLGVTKLDKIIDVFESEDAALRSYAAQL
jgi:anti-sigma B factor antagonist